MDRHHSVLTWVNSDLRRPNPSLFRKKLDLSWLNQNTVFHGQIRSCEVWFGFLLLEIAIVHGESLVWPSKTRNSIGFDTLNETVKDRLAERLVGIVAELFVS